MSKRASLVKRQMLTQSISSGILFATGDLLAQLVVEDNGFLDVARTIRGIIYAGVIMGPLMTLWYNFLNQCKAETKTQTALIRVMLDQMLSAPTTLFVFFLIMGLLEFDVGRVADRLDRDYVPSLLRAWVVFIPTQLVNFSLVPSPFRPLTAGVVSLFWNTYLSAMNANHDDDGFPMVDMSLEMPETIGLLSKLGFEIESQSFGIE